MSVAVLDAILEDRFFPIRLTLVRFYINDYFPSVFTVYSEVLKVEVTPDVSVSTLVIPFPPNHVSSPFGFRKKEHELFGWKTHSQSFLKLVKQ